MKTSSIFRTAAVVLIIIGLAGWFFIGSGRNGSTDKTRLQTGDLIFVGIPADYNLNPDSMSSAISDATGKEGSALNIIHVAIADVVRDSIFIIDATIAHGVDRHPLDTFLRDFTLRDGSLPVFKVMRLGDNSRAADWIAAARQYVGLPYDSAFLPHNDAMYCSELVRESYLNADGSYIFSESPMNFLNAEGEMPVYWTQLFERLGMEVPQGVPGTNPQGMSEEAVLEVISEGYEF